MITKQKVETFLKELKVKMDIFGKLFKNSEVYIKISMGNENNKAICISFHCAERPMNYPLK